ncbi:MAG TPA: hypothetical protein VFN17_08460 [Nitrosarchaeum sp.]|nr:hypothetical protein [Nitrosarchaeum sp.]
MNRKALIIGVMIIVSSLIIISQQNDQIETPIQKNNVDFNSIEWNNYVTKILPKQDQIGEEWTPLWSDSSQEYKQGESPITTTKMIGNNEITSTSYNYQKSEIGTIQILVWHGELFVEWDHKYAVENILNQVNGNVEEIIDNSNLSKNCTIGYYELYKTSESSNDLLFSECAKDGYRIRINLTEGEYSEKTIETMIFFSNLVIEQIR